jgi:hypothetical protein
LALKKTSELGLIGLKDCRINVKIKTNGGVDLDFESLNPLILKILIQTTEMAIN